MTLQQHKEKEAEKWFNETPQKGEVREKQSFISGFDAADPIGFMVFSKNVVLHGYTYNAYWKNWQGSSMGDTITTWQLYLKFIEYKQKQQA